jgi:hypothetical protein
LVAQGFDLGCEFVHADQQHQDSLVYDVMDLYRPAVDALVLARTTFTCGDVVQGRNKARLCWSHLPDWLRVPDRDPSKTSSLQLANGSRILPKPATGKAGRSLIPWLRRSGSAERGATQR